MNQFNAASHHKGSPYNNKLNNDNNYSNTNSYNSMNCLGSSNSSNNKHKFTYMAFNSSLVQQPTFKLFFTLLLLQWVGSGGLAVAVNKTVAGDHCLVVFENSQVRKLVGSVWVSAENPCSIHACEMDDRGRARETITSEDCVQFYCDVDSELRPDNSTCCGICKRTKCRYNDDVYEVGRTWHNPNDCTLLECAQLPDGQPIINAYQKSCPPLPRDCPPGRIYTDGCCQHCNDIKPVMRSAVQGDEDAEDIWTEEYYKSHPCMRECQVNEPPRTCYYKFVVEWYHTLSKACYNCPQNRTDCTRPHCIAGDGVPRGVTVVNRMMPGPSIEVCQNDLVVVDVNNDLLGESTTIHWHGLHQRENPYMDGVPHISQCPISPHATFRYTFRADGVGTHFWHSHTGMQRGDGVFGALIIRRPRSTDPHAHLYDFDLSEHKMILQDWVHAPGVSMFSDHHHSRGDNKPVNLLINGKGRYYKGIWDLIKQEELQQAAPRNFRSEIPANATKPPAPITTLAPEVFELDTTLGPVLEGAEDHLSDIDLLHPTGSAGRMSVTVSNEIYRLARLAKLLEEQSNVDTTTEVIIDSSKSALPTNGSHSPERLGRTRRTAGDYNVSLHEIPLQVYTVQQGFRYRFRIINAEFLNCPIAISVDNHTLNTINSDGYDFEAVEVGSIVTYAGERFDFVIHANQSGGSYWIRLKGLMDCSEKFTSAFQVAILRYENANPDELPPGELGYHHKAPGIQLNAMNIGSGNVDTLTIAELTALPVYDKVSGIDRDALKPVADYKFFVYYDFYAKDNPAFHPAGYYGFNDSVSASNRLFTPQLNHISLKFPSMALLPMRDQVDEGLFCNDTSLEQQGIDCRQQFCKCHHVLQVSLGAVVEIIVVDEGFTFDANHPFHLHGNAFRVVGLERLGANVTVEMVKQLDRYNLLKRNLVRPPVKDTVTVPDGGYTILRFEASNPGYWLFHCHIEFHAEIGMALIIKVGENDQMVPVPKNFPTCGDYRPLPSIVDPENNGQLTSVKPPNSDKPDGNNAPTQYQDSSVLAVLFALLSTLLWQRTIPIS